MALAIARRLASFKRFRVVRRSCAPASTDSGNVELVKGLLARTSSWREVLELMKSCAVLPSSIESHAQGFHRAKIKQEDSGLSRWQDGVFGERLRQILMAQGNTGECLKAHSNLPWPLCVAAGHCAVELALRDAVGRQGTSNRQTATLVAVLSQVYSAPFIRTPQLSLEVFNALLDAILKLDIVSTVPPGDLVRLDRDITVAARTATLESAPQYRRFRAAIDAVVMSNLASLPTDRLATYIGVLDFARDRSVHLAALEHAFERRHTLSAADAIHIVMRVVRSYPDRVGAWLPFLDEAVAPNFTSLLPRSFEQLCFIFRMSSYVPQHIPFTSLLHKDWDRFPPATVALVLNFATHYLNVSVGAIADTLHWLCNVPISQFTTPILLECALALNAEYVRAVCLTRTAVKGATVHTPNPHNACAERLLSCSRTLIDITLQRDVKTFSSNQALSVAWCLLPFVEHGDVLHETNFSSLVNHACVSLFISTLLTSGPHGGSKTDSKSISIMVTRGLIVLADLSRRRSVRRDVYPMLHKLVDYLECVPQELAFSLADCAAISAACVTLRVAPSALVSCIVKCLVSLDASGDLCADGNFPFVTRCAYSLSMLDVTMPTPILLAAFEHMCAVDDMFIEANASMLCRLLWAVMFPGGRAKSPLDIHRVGSFLKRYVAIVGSSSMLISEVQVLCGSMSRLPSTSDSRLSMNEHDEKNWLSFVEQLTCLVGPSLVTDYMSDIGLHVPAAFCLDTQGTPVPYPWLESHVNSNEPPSVEDLMHAHVLSSLGGGVGPAQVRTGRGLLRVAVLPVSSRTRLFNSSRMFGVQRSHVVHLESRGWHVMCVPLISGLLHKFSAYFRDSTSQLVKSHHNWSGYHEYNKLSSSLISKRKRPP